MIEQFKAREKEHELFMDAFKKFDKDGNGHIDFQELKKVLCGTGDRMTDEEVDEFFREADVNNDGKINYKGKNGINANDIGKMMETLIIKMRMV